jgi:D-alanine-D-alanine ligase
VRVAVLLGGVSDEREVSRASGVQVAAALRDAGHEVVAVDTRDGVLTPETEEGIREAGVGEAPAQGVVGHHAPAGRLPELLQDRRLREVDVAFLALHGGAGEDGTVQALLEAARLPFTGSGMLGCALAMDKEVTKRLLRDDGVDTPDWLVGDPEPDEVEAELGLPVVVKAARGGSSLRLLLAHDRGEVEEGRAAARDFGDRALWERYLPGREFTVGVVGREPLPVGEIVPEHEIFDYTCKYEPGMARETFPADLAPEASRRLQHLALRVHDLLRLRDLSRIDFIVDDEGRPWCLEANALPGMTGNSLVPKAARAAGISFPALCDRVVTLALERGAGVG